MAKTGHDARIGAARDVPGADHMRIQVLGGANPVPLPQWRAIAAKVLGA